LFCGDSQKDESFLLNQFIVFFSGQRSKSLGCLADLFNVHGKKIHNQSNYSTAKKMMQLYWDLASLEPMERQTAAKQLIEALKAHIPEEKEGATVESLLTDESAYALKRLVRGLPSSRDAARQGFSLALSEVQQ
jgi:hypothetical protein